MHDNFFFFFFFFCLSSRRNPNLLLLLIQIPTTKERADPWRTVGPIIAEETNPKLWFCSSWLSSSVGIRICPQHFSPARKSSMYRRWRHYRFLGVGQWGKIKQIVPWKNQVQTPKCEWKNEKNNKIHTFLTKFNGIFEGMPMHSTKNTYMDF